MICGCSACKSPTLRLTVGVYHKRELVDGFVDAEVFCNEEEEEEVVVPRGTHYLYLLFCNKDNASQVFQKARFKSK